MSSPEKLKGQAQELYAMADKIEDRAERLRFVMLALELETEAAVLAGGGSLPTPVARPDGRSAATATPARRSRSGGYASS